MGGSKMTNEANLRNMTNQELVTELLASENIDSTLQNEVNKRFINSMEYVNNEIEEIVSYFEEGSSDIAKETIRKFSKFFEEYLI
jgi:ribosomal protein L17